MYVLFRVVTTKRHQRAVTYRKQSKLPNEFVGPLSFPTRGTTLSCIN